MIRHVEPLDLARALNVEGTVDGIREDPPSEDGVRRSFLVESGPRADAGDKVQMEGMRQEDGDLC